MGQDCTQRHGRDATADGAAAPLTGRPHDPELLCPPEPSGPGPQGGRREPPCLPPARREHSLWGQTLGKKEGAHFHAYTPGSCPDPTPLLAQPSEDPAGRGRGGGQDPPGRVSDRRPCAPVEAGPPTHTQRGSDHPKAVPHKETSIGSKWGPLPGAEGASRTMEEPPLRGLVWPGTPRPLHPSPPSRRARPASPLHG